MKLPNFFEELNQGAEKAFAEHAQTMIDSLLYAERATQTETLSQYGST